MCIETATRRFADIMPDRIKRLPIDHRGFPVPHFVAWIDGKPDHRVMDRAKLWPAIHKKRCWICGEPLGANLAFPIGPMCSITRTISEPPSHRSCAEFAAKVCPFLAIPEKRRREKNLPDNIEDPAGIPLKRNPGAIALWICKRFQARMEPNGILFTIGEPHEVAWYCEGRAATRKEVEDSMISGLPALIELARQEGAAAERLLQMKIQIACQYLPKAE